MKYKVFIPSAGLGSRLLSYSKHMNKALVTLSNRPAITYIIEKFPKDVEIVVALGYKKESIKDFLNLAYPDRKFVFVDVDKYEGPGSGLGLTMLKCKEHLQCPFVFTCNDTIITEDMPLPDYNWMGYVESKDVSLYRSLRLDTNGLVAEICSKGATGDVKLYIGLAGIKDYKEFWDAMEKGTAIGSIEVGESYGLKFLIDKTIKAIKFDWYDMGNLDSLDKARKHFVNNDGPNILEKEGEAIWFLNDKVVKFSIDKSFIENRVKRASLLAPYVPEIIQNNESMYAYKKIEGEVFSEKPKLSEFKYFLKWMDGFWKRKELSKQDSDKFKKICTEFYKDKTLERMKQYFARFEQIDIEEIINNHQVPRLNDILNKVDWNYIADGIPARFHGDLHFENILINSSNSKQPFTLLDWRQDFAGLLEYGDIYYDLAKLNHGLIISHEIISKNLFSVNHKLDNVSYDFHRKQSLVDCENYLKTYIVEHGYDLKKVQILTALIFLNIAPLHHYPYTLLLFYLGKTMLNELVN